MTELEIQSFTDRFNAEGMRDAYHSTLPPEENDAIFLKNLLASGDVEAIDSAISGIEVLAVGVLAEKAALEAEEQVGNDLSFGNKVILKFLTAQRQGVGGLSRNERRTRSKRLHSKFKDVKDLLTSGNIEAAKDELLDIDVDADFSQASKDGMESIFNNYLGE